MTELRRELGAGSKLGDLIIRFTGCLCVLNGYRGWMGSIVYFRAMHPTFLLPKSLGMRAALPDLH